MAANVCAGSSPFALPASRIDFSILENCYTPAPDWHARYRATRLSKPFAFPEVLRHYLTSFQESLPTIAEDAKANSDEKIPLQRDEIRRPALPKELPDHAKPVEDLVAIEPVIDISNEGSQDCASTESAFPMSTEEPKAAEYSRDPAATDPELPAPDPAGDPMVVEPAVFAEDCPTTESWTEGPNAAETLHPDDSSTDDEPVDSMSESMHLLRLEARSGNEAISDFMDPPVSKTYPAKSVAEKVRRARRKQSENAIEVSRSSPASEELLDSTEATRKNSSADGKLKKTLRSVADQTGSAKRKRTAHSSQRVPKTDRTPSDRRRPAQTSSIGKPPSKVSRGKSFESKQDAALGTSRRESETSQLPFVSNNMSSSRDIPQQTVWNHFKIPKVDRTAIRKPEAPAEAASENQFAAPKVPTSRDFVKKRHATLENSNPPPLKNRYKVINASALHSPIDFHQLFSKFKRRKEFFEAFKTDTLNMLKKISKDSTPDIGYQKPSPERVREDPRRPPTPRPSCKESSRESLVTKRSPTASTPEPSHQEPRPPTPVPVRKPPTREPFYRELRPSSPVPVRKPPTREPSHREPRPPTPVPVRKPPTREPATPVPQSQKEKSTSSKTVCEKKLPEPLSNPTCRLPFPFPVFEKVPRPTASPAPENIREALPGPSRCHKLPPSVPGPGSKSVSKLQPVVRNALSIAPPKLSEVVPGVPSNARTEATKIGAPSVDALDEADDPDVLVTYLEESDLEDYLTYNATPDSPWSPIVEKEHSIKVDSPRPEESHSPMKKQGPVRFTRIRD